MSYPTKPDPAYDYPTYQAGSPLVPLPATQVYNDLNERKTSIDEVIDFLKVSLRSDNKVSAGMVPAAALAPDALAIVSDWEPRGAWLTATAYAVKDTVTNSDAAYVCLVAHTSGTFATDLAAGKWMVISNDVPWSRVVGAATFEVATLADLKALTDRPAVVFVASRTTHGDGFAGAFRWVDGSSTTADDAIVVEPTSGTSGRWKRIYAGAIDALWFGFKPDGLSASGSANSTALQAAITLGIATATAVELPAGTAYLASAINISGSVKVRGKGWGTILRPTADAITNVFNVTGSTIEISDMLINGDTVVSPTFTAIKVNTSGGFVRVDNVYIYGCGIGVYMPAGNACRFSNMRIQACPVCVQTGGVSGSYPGDTTWQEIVAIPTSTGTGWIIDGNSNAQYMNRVQIIGGAINLHVRGSGSSTSTPDGILQTLCNYTASSGPVVKIVKCWNFQLSDSVVGGSTGDDGILIDPATTADVDGVLLDGCQVRANYKRGINWVGGANVQIIGGQVYGNSDGGGSGTYSNVYVGASAKGLFQMMGVMAGMSATGEVLANVQAPAKYGVELASGALTDATNHPGRCFIVNNMLDGNTTGTISDGSAPTGARKVIKNSGSSEYTNSLGADVTMSDTSLWYEGPKVSQGTTGRWLAGGTVTFELTAGNVVHVKLWDGTTVIASTTVTAAATTGNVSASLLGYISNPAGDIRISAKSPGVGAAMKYNSSGNGKDSTLSVTRVSE